MFTVDYNSQNPEANVLVKQQDIFQNTLTIKSVHCYYETVKVSIDTATRSDGGTCFETNRYYNSICCSIHRNIPIDIIYKSAPQGEKFFIVLWGDTDSKQIIFNIDGKTNLKLKYYDDESDSHRENYNLGDWESESNLGKRRFYDEKEKYYNQRINPFLRIYFEITKEQLQKLCSATTLMLQTSSEEGSVQFEGNANGFITILQALYNEVFDNQMYQNAKNDAFSFIENAIIPLEEKNKKELSKTSWPIWFVIGICIVIIITLLICLG